MILSIYIPKLLELRGSFSFKVGMGSVRLHWGCRGRSCGGSVSIVSRKWIGPFSFTLAEVLGVELEVLLNTKFF